MFLFFCTKQSCELTYRSTHILYVRICVFVESVNALFFFFSFICFLTSVFTSVCMSFQFLRATSLPVSTFPQFSSCSSCHAHSPRQPQLFLVSWSASARFDFSLHSKAQRCIVGSYTIVWVLLHPFF